MESMKLYSEIVTRNTDLIAAMSSLIDAPKTTGRRPLYNQDRGLSENSDMWKHAVGEHRVYRQEVLEDRIEVQVGIIVDDSGSMGYKSRVPINEAREVCGCLVESMLGCAIDLKVYTIGGKKLWETSDGDEYISSCVNFDATGGTPTGTAVTNLANAMLSTEGEFSRRIIFIITDGDADSVDNHCVNCTQPGFILFSHHKIACHGKNFG